MKTLSALMIFFMLFFFNNRDEESDKLIIRPNKGVGNIEIGKSTLDDVINEYGKIEKNKKWHKSIELELFGRFEYYLHYDSIGIFSTYTKNRNKEVIHKIILPFNSKCRTIKGNGIGSGYDDIVEEFGSTDGINLFGYNNNKVIELTYDNMHIIFDSNDMNACKVVEIIIW